MIGAHFVLGSTVAAFVIDNYPEIFGRDISGNCIDSRKCDIGTQINMTEFSERMSRFEEITVIMWTCIELFLLCLLLNLAKRMVYGSKTE